MTVWCGLVGYLFGSLPFALFVARWRAGVDVRVVGSGNVGAANVQRSAGTMAALMTAGLDVAKGAVPVLLARAAGLGADLCAVAGAAAVLGHVYPVWLRFRGGKGVSTMFGACLVLAPVVAGMVFVVFVLAVGGTRMVSVGSVLAAAATAPLAWAWGAPMPSVTALAAMSAVVLLRHRSNVARVAAGAERRLGAWRPRA